jgi:hypothetical protein
VPLPKSSQCSVGCGSITPVTPELEGLFCHRREWRLKVLDEEDAFFFIISVSGKCNDARRFALKCQIPMLGCIGGIAHHM